MPVHFCDHVDREANPTEPDNRLTVAFLKCDKLEDASVAKVGKYEDVIHDLMEPALPERMTLEVLTFDAVQKHLPTEKQLEFIDALVISGSFEDDAHEDKQWILRLAGFLIGCRDNYPRIRIVGICFGLQVIARAFGPSTIVPNDKGWEVGSTKVWLTDLGQELIWGDSSDSKNYLMTQQIHADIVKTIPDDFELLAYSELTPIQGVALLYKEGNESPMYQHSYEHQLPPDPWRRVHIIAFQGHPEWDEHVLIPFIDKYEKAGTFDAQFAEGARKRSKEHHDGLTLGRAILKVMGVA